MTEVIKIAVTILLGFSDLLLLWRIGHEPRRCRSFDQRNCPFPENRYDQAGHRIKELVPEYRIRRFPESVIYNVFREKGEDEQEQGYPFARKPPLYPRQNRLH